MVKRVAEGPVFSRESVSFLCLQSTAESYTEDFTLGESPQSPLIQILRSCKCQGLPQSSNLHLFALLTRVQLIDNRHHTLRLRGSIDHTQGESVTARRPDRQIFFDIAQWIRWTKGTWYHCQLRKEGIPT